MSFFALLRMGQAEHPCWFHLIPHGVRARGRAAFPSQHDDGSHTRVLQRPDTEMVFKKKEKANRGRTGAGVGSSLLRCITGLEPWVLGAGGMNQGRDRPIAASVCH